METRLLVSWFSTGEIEVDKKMNPIGMTFTEPSRHQRHRKHVHLLSTFLSFDHFHAVDLKAA
jgi:hypothetical protein